jgi:hypothetical protein
MSGCLTAFKLTLKILPNSLVLGVSSLKLPKYPITRLGLESIPEVSGRTDSRPLELQTVINRSWECH